MSVFGNKKLKFTFWFSLLIKIEVFLGAIFGKCRILKIFGIVFNVKIWGVGT